MDIKRLILIAGASLCVLVAYTAENIAMDRVARWIEVDQDGYLWWSEEWMQLFEANNFVDRGKGRILLTGSSEVREGFLFDEFESELHGFEVYNNAYSNHTLQTLMVVLQYIESAYGPSAVPDKIVLGVAPLFLLDEPSIDRSYLPKVIDRYSPFFNLDTGSRPVRLVSKGWRDSLEARYRYLTHQSRRFQGTMRGLMRFGAHSRLHTFKIERLSLDQPIVVELVDTKEKLERFLGFIDGQIEEGLATLEKVQIHFYRSGQTPPMAVPESPQ